MPAFLSRRLGSTDAPGADVLVVPVTSPGAGLHARLRRAGVGVADAAARAVDLGDFTGEAGTHLLLHARGFESFPRVLLLGVPGAKERSASAVRSAFSGVAVDPVLRRLDTAAILVDGALGTGAELQAAVAAAVDGLYEGAYRWTRSTDPSANGGASGSGGASASGPGQWSFLASDVRSRQRVTRGIADGLALAEGVTFAKDLANTPANEMGPRELGQAAESLAGGAVKVRVLSGAALQKARLHGILAVGGGSSRAPRLIVIEYRPRGTAKVPPIALVGKGLVYDTGGLSIKPTASMVEMKFDKCGGCVVLGAVKTVAAMGWKTPLVAVVPAVENSISGDSYRPGDIISSRAGKTIEVLNTDAEGRIALADGLDYAITEFAPRVVLDAATLTGAVYHALSDRSCAVLGNDDRVVERLVRAGETVGERAWQLPLWPEHLEDVQTPRADVRNTGSAGGGTIAGAAFLECFVRGVPWAHLDIANVSRDRRNPAVGATGFGVRLLAEALRTWPTPRGRRTGRK